MDSPIITVPEIAKRHGMNTSYIREEIHKGRLKAEKQGGTWIIKLEDYEKWLANPRRGSRSKQK